MGKMLFTSLLTSSGKTLVDQLRLKAPFKNNLKACFSENTLLKPVFSVLYSDRYHMRLLTFKKMLWLHLALRTKTLRQQNWS